MVGILFDGKNEVENEKVIDKMNYFIRKAENGMELYHKNNKRESLSLAKELRSELDTEYKNNDLNRISKFYENHELFARYYKWAVHEASASVTGVLSYEKLHGFLYDVRDYMRFYLPNTNKS